MNASLPRLLELAERQYSVFSLGDARDLGIPDDVVWELSRRQAIERVAPGVWRVRGSGRSFRQRVKANSLALGDEVLASWWTSAALLRLDLATSRVMHFSAARPNGRGRRNAAIRLHRVTNLLAVDRRVVDGIPCTSAARTVLDLAGSLSDEALETMAESARRMGLMTIGVLEARFESIGRIQGAGRVRRYIDANRGQAPLEYRLEIKTRRLLETMRPRRSFRRQLPIVAAGERYFVDFCFEHDRLIVECDGFAWHGNRLQWKRDRRRVAALEAVGWRVMHVTWEDVVERPEQTLARIRLALE